MTGVDLREHSVSRHLLTDKLGATCNCFFEVLALIVEWSVGVDTLFVVIYVPEPETAVVAAGDCVVDGLGALQDVGVEARNEDFSAGVPGLVGLLDELITILGIFKESVISDLSQFNLV